MNIFYLHNDVDECSRQHVDKHVVKMIVEYAQLLSCAHRVLDTYVGEECYKQSHTNHPSAKWVRASHNNYCWLYELWVSLMNEYTYRYGKIHSTARLKDFLGNPPRNIPIGPFTEPPPAMPEQYKVPGDSIQSYKNYYTNEKRHIAKWKLRQQPTWFN